MRKLSLSAVLMVVTALVVSGCGAGVSEDKPISEVKVEAQKMDVSQIKSMVAKYQKAIDAKKPEIQKLQSKLKGIPITQIMGAEAKGIKTDMGQITSSIKALTERMKIYITELNKKQ